MATLPPTADDKLIWDWWLSAHCLPTLTVADEVGTFRSLGYQPMTTEELAADIKADARALGIHLGLLAAMGLVERREQRWQLTAASRMWMHPEAEGYFGPLFFRYRTSNALHSQLLSTLRSGEKASDNRTGVEEWERGEMSADLAKQISAFMNSHSQASARGVAAQPILSSAANVLDVGGGSGIFAIQMAKSWPSLKATVMDIAAVCEVAQDYIEQAKVADRVSVQIVNMFTEVWPENYDVHFLSNILHDWSDDTCRLLLSKSFDALPSGGLIALNEMLMDDDGCGPLTTASFAVLMLLGTRGRQFTQAELREFLEGAGFTQVRSIQTGGGYYSLVTARKP